MIKSFLKIRSIQIFRSIKDIGIFRILFLIILLFALGFILFKITSDVKNCYYISIILAIIIFLFHLKRKDRIFIKINFNNYKLLHLIEYLFYSLPFIIFFIIHLNWLPVLIIILLISIISQFDLEIKLKSKNYKILRLIPDRNFEMKSGIRKVLYLILIIWSIGFLTSPFIGSVPVSIFILGIISFVFYNECEPYQMIIAYELKVSKFLFYKIKSQVIFFSIISFPLILLFFIFHHDVWYIPVLEYFIFLSIHIYQLLTKYAFYEPNEKPSAAQIFEILGILSLLIPLFLPLIWIMSVRFYFKSKEKLNIYLNDYY